MCEWATEHHEENVTAALGIKKIIALQQMQKLEKINQSDLMKKLKKEKQIFDDDLVCSQNVLRIMRHSGMIVGVNAGDKNNAHEPTTIVNSEFLELHLRKGVNFDDYNNGRISRKIKNHGEKKNGKTNENRDSNVVDKDKNANNSTVVRFLEASSEDENENENGEEYNNNTIISPFNVDLSSGSADVLHLQCFLIGERGTFDIVVSS